MTRPGAWCLAREGDIAPPGEAHVTVIGHWAKLKDSFRAPFQRVLIIDEVQRAQD